MPILTTTSASYLSGCGPEDPIRFDENKNIDLLQYLPSYLKEKEVSELILFFQDFLNTLYQEKTYTTSASEYEIFNRPKISILEKIDRLTELQDPDFIDIEYINFFAKNLGYDVDVSRGELGIFNTGNSDDVCVQEDSKRYLRFVVESLPSWYKIKCTNNAVKIMLYSFGLVGDLITRYTNDYRADVGLGNWINVRDSSFIDIPKDFYPTPHFVLNIELDESVENFSLNRDTRFNIFNAIESIRPINSVNDGIVGHVEREHNIQIIPFFTKKYYIKMSL